MLNVFKLQEAVNESVNGQYRVPSVEAHEFIGTMDEAVVEFNDIIMTEAVEFKHFIACSDEIMTEAALNNPDRVDSIQEASFGNIKEGMLKLFRKIKEAIKGMINKLKALFFKLTKKTDDWIKIMKPRIEAAKKNSGTSDMQYEMHNWDIDYITNGMRNALADAGREATWSLLIPDDANKANILTNLASFEKDDPNSEAFKAKIAKYDEIIQKTREEGNKTKENLLSKFSNAFGVSKQDNIQDMWTEVAHKATGGEKVAIKFVPMVDKMVKAVEESKKTIKGLEDFYTKHYGEIKKTEKEFNSYTSKFEIKDADNYPAEAVRVARAMFSANCQQASTILTFNESACSTAQGMNVGYIKTMASEYMGALTKFAGSKSKIEK